MTTDTDFAGEGLPPGTSDFLVFLSRCKSISNELYNKEYVKLSSLVTRGFIELNSKSAKSLGTRGHQITITSRGTAFMALLPPKESQLGVTVSGQITSINITSAGSGYVTIHEC
jgi:hypothetical protein